MLTEWTQNLSCRANKPCRARVLLRQFQTKWVRKFIVTVAVWEQSGHEEGSRLTAKEFNQQLQIT